MPKFFVGQRVRILFSNNWPELAGQEGRVTRCNVSSALLGGGVAEGACNVAPDSWGGHYAPRPALNGISIRFAPEAHQIEPILPEGHKAGEFSYEELLEHLETLSHENA